MIDYEKLEKYKEKYMYQNETFTVSGWHTNADLFYLPIPPKIVIEVDTKASFEDFNTPMDYYTKKTDALLNFGVEKVIWIFTDAKKVMVAVKNSQWLIDDWTANVEIMENLGVNIENLLREI